LLHVAAARRRGARRAPAGCGWLALALALALPGAGVAAAAVQPWARGGVGDGCALLRRALGPARPSHSPRAAAAWAIGPGDAHVA
jgi:hypothetical protein